MKIYTKSGPKIGAGRVDISGARSVVVLFASFFFRQFSFCCLTGHSQSFLMLVKTAHNYL